MIRKHSRVDRYNIILVYAVHVSHLYAGLYFTVNGFGWINVSRNYTLNNTGLDKNL